jgi:hypothetical protein
MPYSCALLSSFICLPPKIKLHTAQLTQVAQHQPRGERGREGAPHAHRCCAGGMPSFSSTRSLIRAICARYQRQRVQVAPGACTHLVRGVNVNFHLQEGGMGAARQ